MRSSLSCGSSSISGNGSSIVEGGKDLQEDCNSILIGLRGGLDLGFEILRFWNVRDGGKVTSSDGCASAMVYDKLNTNRNGGVYVILKIDTGN